MLDFFSFFQKSDKIYFLSSFNIKKTIGYKSFINMSKIKIENITKKKNISVDLYELKVNIKNDNSLFELEIEIDNKSFILCSNNIKKGTNFIFNKTIIDKNTKEKMKLNCFDINEEFDIYYHHFKNMSKLDIESLIKSSLKIIEDGGKDSTFSFLFHLFTKYTSIFTNIKDINSFLIKIKDKGDLSKIDKNKVQIIFDSFNCNYNPIIIIYSIFNDIDYLKKMINNKVCRHAIFACLVKYNNLFSKSIELFPDYSFLIDKSNSLQEIIDVLKCSYKLSDFIFLINKKKEHISKYIKEDLILINDYFNMENEFNKSFNDHFYISLISLKEYAKKIINV